MLINNYSPKWRYIRGEVTGGLFICARSTGLARFPRSRLATLFFTKISMCSCEKAGWPGCRDLGFCDRDLGNRTGNFSHMKYRDCPGRNIFNCVWLVRSLTSRNAVPRVFWGPFGYFSSCYTGSNFPYEQRTKFVPSTVLI